MTDSREIVRLSAVDSKSKSLYKDMKRLKPKHFGQCGLHEWDNSVQGQGRSDQKPVRARSALIQAALKELKVV